MPKSKDYQSPKGILKLVLTRSAAALIITVIIIALAALLVSGGRLPIGSMLPIVIVAVFIGVFTGSGSVARRVEHHKLPFALMVSVVLFILSLMGGLLSFPPSGHGLLLGVSSLAAGLLGGLTSQKPKKARK